MTPNEIKAEARHRTAAMILGSLIDAGAVKIDADKKYAIPHDIDGKTVWTEITITAKRDDYNPHESAAKIEAEKKVKKA